MGSRLEFFFDFSCPYAYLAMTQVEALAQRAGATLEYCPMLLGGVFKAVNTAQVLYLTYPEPKNRHNLADMKRWADLWNVPLEMPAGHPMRTARALRLVLASGCAPALIHRIYGAYWGEGLDIAEDDVLRRLAGESGLDGAALVERLEEPQLKEALRSHTDRAVALGIFGAPSFLVDGALLFWGQDRLEFVEKALNGWRPRAEGMIDVLERARPRVEE